MKALVTGSNGFLGAQFAMQLRARGWTVAVCDPRGPDHSSALFVFRTSAGAFDLVVHCAARNPHRVAIDTQPAGLLYNQLLDAALFEWAARTRQKRVLYISSCAALDAKPDAYGLLKLTGERLAGQAAAAGVITHVVRPYSGYGEYQSTAFPFGAFAKRARLRQDPFEIWGDGTQVRDWIHVEDVVGAALAVVDNDVREPVSLCTGIGTSMFQLADMMVAEVGYMPDFELHPEKPAGTGYRVGDPTKMLEFYEPRISLAEGVKRAVAS